jgi:hypothetical protein
MPEIIPSRPIHFQHPDGAVRTGWAMFVNLDTRRVEVHSVNAVGATVVSWLELAEIVPSTARDRITGGDDPLSELIRLAG